MIDTKQELLDIAYVTSLEDVFRTYNAYNKALDKVFDAQELNKDSDTIEQLSEITNDLYVVYEKASTKMTTVAKVAQDYSNKIRTTKE
tara:strand:+ start:402 stop:665 length:264 start_codon:yes stop_codon:yes gene_type:complete